MSSARIAERGAAYTLQAAVAPAFGTSFDLLATAPQGVAKVWELILSMAMQGKLLSSLDLRQRWRQATLDEIGEWGSGGTPLRTNSEYYDNGTIPWLVIGDLNDGVVTEAATSITASGLASSSTKLVPPGTLLIAMYGSIGKLGITGISCATNQAIAHCKPNEGVVLTQFLFFFLFAIRPALLGRGKGLAQQNISQKILKSVEIAVPPLAEQARIVARVEELMQLCDALEAHGRLQDEQHARLVATLFDALASSASAEALAENWQRIATHFDLLLDRPEAVDALEQTLLQLAVRGLLVPQDPAEEPASELLVRIRTEKDRLIALGKIKRDKPLPPVTDNEWWVNLPAGWCWCRLQDAFDVRDGTHDSPKFQNRGFPLVTSKNIYGGHLDLSDVKFISPEDHANFSARSGVSRDDILMAMIGSIGNPVIVDTDVEFSIKNVALFKYYSRELSSPEFLLLMLQVSSIVMKAEAAGGVQSFVSLGRLRNQPIALPPLAEQHRIVARVEQLRRLCAYLRERLQQARATQSRLADALVSAAAQSPTC